MMKSILKGAAASSIMLLSIPAEAVVFDFDLSGAYNATFAIDSAKFAPPASFDQDTFIVENVAGTFDGNLSTSESMTFNTAGFGGGLTIQLGGGFFGFLGDQVFTGSTATPQLRSGTYVLASDVDGAESTLVISAAAGAVPEPATWAMMVAGFGVVGCAMRGGRRKTRVHFA